MISKNFCKSIRLYVKTIPWFLSDVMTDDLNWLLNELEVIRDEHLNTLSQRWKGYFQNGTWIIVESKFWTLPFDYSFMPKVDPNLYKQLAEAKAIFFKGKCVFFFRKNGILVVRQIEVVAKIICIGCNQFVK